MKRGPYEKRQVAANDSVSTSDYDERYTKPTTGEECNECKSKEAAGNCPSRVVVETL